MPIPARQLADVREHVEEASPLHCRCRTLVIIHEIIDYLLFCRWELHTEIMVISVLSVL